MTSTKRLWRGRRLASPAARCLALGIVVVLGGSACFGSTTQQRRYYTLHLVPTLGGPVRCLAGAAYVRDLNAESAYDKYQFVVRTSPFELAYRESQVWAVRPNRMLSDLIARALTERRVFDAVARELGSQRPDYIVAGDLQAIEAYDSGDLWFAHLALTLHATDFKSGEVIWTYGFDERKEVKAGDFSNLTRALSELLSNGVEGGMASLGAVAERLGKAACTAAPVSTPKPKASDDNAAKANEPRVILVPQREP